MKYEDYATRLAYDKEYQWRCTSCGKPLSNADIRWGQWKNGNGYHKDLSRCCDRAIARRV